MQWPCAVSLPGLGTPTKELPHSGLKLGFVCLFACDGGHLTWHGPYVIGCNEDRVLTSGACGKSMCHAPEMLGTGSAVSKRYVNASWYRSVSGPDVRVGEDH